MNYVRMMDFYTQILYPVLDSIQTHSSRNAFCIDEKFYTYEQFRQSISKIRKALAEAKCNNNKVGLVINDDLDTYASIFALWLEGCSYVPLHPDWPIERCHDICGQIDADLIIDSSEETRYQGVQVIKTADLDYTEDFIEFKQGVSDEELAYILFTSGSTGKPKGVTISRGALAEFVRAYPLMGAPTLTCEDRTLQCFDLTFDLSIQGYLLSVLSGGCCYTIPPGQVKYLYASMLLEDEKITIATLVPSMLRYLEPYFDEIDASSLRCCTVTAEAVHFSLLKKWMKCAPNTVINNMCGATETTINCTYYLTKCDDSTKTHNDVICVGRPMDGSGFIIVDENGNELERGEMGEICYSGKQLTSGYWKNDAQNEKAFFFRKVDGKSIRFYHSGDLGFIDESGDLFHCGRLDHQAKIQGFRVELGEIEFHAREFLKDKDVVCMAFDNKDNLTEIAMFVESEQFDSGDLLAYMRTKMPSYMIPTRLFFVPVFPLNANDKTDKVALKNMI